MHIAALEVSDIAGCPALARVRFDGPDGFEAIEASGDHRFSYVIDGQLSVDRVADAFFFFLPFLVSVPAESKPGLRLHLYTWDARYRGAATLADHDDHMLRDRFLERINQLADDARRAGGDELWQRVDELGLHGLVDAVWSRTTISCLDDTLFAAKYANDVHDIEHHALQTLAANKRISDDGFADALDSIRALIRAAEPVPGGPGGSAPPPTLTRADTSSGLLLASRIAGDVPPFRVINRGALAYERSKAKAAFVGRPPTWADVVDGPNPVTCFVERTQLTDLLDQVQEAVIKPLRQGVSSQLPALFVLGSPGSGKSTIVRRAVSQLVDAGEIIAVDLGTNHGPYASDDMGVYVDAFRYLAERCDRPTVLVMDDPLFAGSGWDVLLKRLAGLAASRGTLPVGVVAASPTFLMEAYGHTISDRKIKLQQFVMTSPTRQERLDLAAVFNRAEDELLDRDDDFIVLAMEAAVGVSFDEIIGRIWETLNDGLPISRRTRARELPWTVRALMIVAFFHRYAALCPLKLLGSSLVEADSKPDPETYAYALSELQIADGWLIFRISTGGDRHDPVEVISTMHPRVAERIWELRPDRGFNVAEWILPASVRLPSSAMYLAQVADVGRHGLSVADHALTKQLIETWSQPSIPTWQFCRMVRELGLPAQTAALVPLRARWRKKDEQSWIAVWSLIQRARRGSEERSRLEGVDMPYCLRNGDLSLEPALAMKVASNSRYRSIVREAVVGSLTGRSKWRLDHRLLAWAIDHDAALVPDHLGELVEWFAEAPLRWSATLALGRWYKSHSAHAPLECHEFALETLGEWIAEGECTRGVVAHFLQLLPLCRRTLGVEADGLVAHVLQHVDQWIEHNQQDSALVADRLGLMRGGVESVGAYGRVLGDTRRWLSAHPDDQQIRVSYLAIAGGLKSASPVPIQDVLTDTQAWLWEHEDDNSVRTQFLSVVSSVGSASPIPIQDVLDDTRAWLEAHPDDVQVRTQFLSVVFSLGSASPIPIQDVLVETQAWLQTHEDDNSVRTKFLSVVFSLGSTSPIPIPGVLTDTWAWLQAHPDDSHVRTQFLSTTFGPGSVCPIPVDEILADTQAWLQIHPDDIHVRTQFLSATYGLGSNSPIPIKDVLADAHDWLRTHTSDSHVRTQFLSVVFSLGSASPIPLRDVLIDAQAWLQVHRNDVEVRRQVLVFVAGLGPDSPIPADEVLTDTWAWLQAHRDDVEVRRQFLVVTAGLGSDPPIPADEVLTDTWAWLQAHRDDVEVRRQFLVLVGGLGSDSPIPAAEVLTDTRAWLRAHPDDVEVRRQFLVLVGGPGRDSPIPPGEVLTDTWAWLQVHPDDVEVRRQFFVFAGGVAAPWPIPAGDVVAGTLAWLRAHPHDARVRIAFVSMVAQAGSIPSTTLADVLADTQTWLQTHTSTAITNATQVIASRLPP